jgi:SAM-dependent methyltransferase
MDTRDRLHLFYDAKYQAEASAPLREVVSYNGYPSNRFEACMRFFMNRFQGGDILELGAGSGLLAQSLIAHGLRFHSYTVSEIAESRLTGLARNLNDPRVRVIQLDAESIPEAEFSRYDAIIMLALIAQLIDPLGAMQQVRKLLRSGGFAFIETSNIAKFTRRAKLMSGRFPAISSTNEGLITYEGNPVGLHDEGHLHYFTFRSLSLMLIQRCGFSRVEKLSYFVGPKGRKMPGHRMGSRLARLWPEMFSEIVLVAYA